MYLELLLKSLQAIFDPLNCGVGMELEGHVHVELDPGTDNDQETVADGASLLRENRVCSMH